MGRALDNRHAKQQALQESTQRASVALNIPATDWLTVQRRTLNVGVPISGSLTAVESAIVKARVPGELRDLQVREGDSVSQGQIIARVDATEAEARHRQARLQAEAARAQVTINQRQYDNNRALVDQGFISATALATSQANLQAAQANHAAALAAQDGARKTLDDTVLRSPIHGQVARRMAQNGERVNVEAPVIEVVNMEALELEAQLPANDSAKIQVGQSARLALDGADDSQIVTARVVRINPVAAAGNRAVPVYLRIEDTPPDITLRPGMYVQGQIQTGTVSALAVPLLSIRTDQPLPYVQAVQDSKVIHQQVKMGIQSQDEGQTWVAVEGIAQDTPILAGSAGGVPAATVVQLQASTGSSAPKTASPSTSQ